MATRRLTKEEKQQRAAALRGMLEQAKREYAEDDAQRARYDRALAAVTSIEGHPYSLNNLMLPEKQATVRGLTLTRLGAFRAWIKHGRAVRKGERGLMAYAPHSRHTTAATRRTPTAMTPPRSARASTSCTCGTSRRRTLSPRRTRSRQRRRCMGRSNDRAAPEGRQINTRVPEHMWDQIEQLARFYCLNRASVARVLIAEALRARERCWRSRPSW